MNSISKQALFALTALSLAGSATANPYGLSNIFGRVKDALRSNQYGLADLGDEDFPTFGTFAWRDGGNRFSSAFGMAYRTHRHILDRQDEVATSKYSLLDNEKPLSHWDDSERRPGGTTGHAPLVVTVKVDTRTRPVYLAQEEDPSDLFSVIHARLESTDRQSLTLAIRSRDGSRIRPVFVYFAEVPQNSRNSDDKNYWECKFYDPSIQITGANSIDRSIVDGDPKKAEGGRFHKLRFPRYGAQRLQVHRSWIEDVRKHGSDGAAFGSGDGEWIDLDPSQLYQVDHGAEAWEATGSDVIGDGVDTLASGIFQSLRQVNETVSGGAFADHVAPRNLRYGAYDQAELHPGAPAPETD